MKFGDDTISKVRGEKAKHWYKIDGRFEVLVKRTDVHTWTPGDDWDPQAIEGEVEDAGELRREMDKDGETEYVTFWYTTRVMVDLNFQIESDRGMDRSRFTKAQIREWVKERVVDAEFEEILGVEHFLVTESRVAVKDG